MTVTQLREALQKLEARGQGMLPVIHWEDHHGDLQPLDVNAAELTPAPDKKTPWRSGFRTDTDLVVTLT